MVVVVVVVVVVVEVVDVSVVIVVVATGEVVVGSSTFSQLFSSSPKIETLQELN